LTSFDGYTGYAQLYVTGSGTVLAPVLTTFTGVSIDLDGTGTIATSQWSSLIGGSLTVSGGSYTLSGLTDLNDSNVFVQDGATLTLPGLVSYSADPGTATTLEATGTLSLLAFPSLASLTADTNAAIDAEALSGGTVYVPASATVTGSVTFT